VAKSLRGIKPASKPLLIPFLLYQFRRLQRGPWVFNAFLGSCTLLMIVSRIVLCLPQFKFASTASAGVPV
jgi:O-antigen ligase